MSKKSKTPIILIVTKGLNDRPFRSLGHCVNNPSVLETSAVKLVVFTGGADISPYLYGEIAYHRTRTDAQRDHREVGIFRKALQKKIPMYGICRGAQFLCAMAGGKLIQHVDNHHSHHQIMTSTGHYLRVNSIHHQMQIPPSNAKILAWAEPPCSSCYLPQGVEPPLEYECVYYPQICSVGVQYHPEIMDENSDGFQYAVHLAKKLIEKPDNPDFSEPGLQDNDSLYTETTEDDTTGPPVKYFDRALKMVRQCVKQGMFRATIPANKWDMEYSEMVALAERLTKAGYSAFVWNGSIETIIVVELK